MYINLMDVLEVIGVFAVFIVPMYALARWSERGRVYPGDGKRPRDGFPN